jgi:hypothetical protein
MIATAAPALTAPAPRPFLTRALAVVRLLIANPWISVLVPVGILSFIFALNYVLFRLLSSQATEDGEWSATTGGISFVYIYVLILAVTSVNQSFPLALGLGSTRREFTVGTGIYFGVASVVIAAVIATAAEIETATDGWGIPFQFFALQGVGVDSWGALFAFSLLLLALAVSVGFMTAVIYVRWKARGMYVYWILVTLLVLGVIASLVGMDDWGAIGRFVVEAQALGIAATSLVITVPAALVGYALLRRAVPPGA